jgi:C4-dicarboxylate-specific signal transduction histidine kinase
MIQGLDTQRLVKNHHQILMQVSLALIFCALGLLALQSATTARLKEISAEYDRLIDLEAQQLSNDLSEPRTLLATLPFEKGTIKAVDAAVNHDYAALTERLALIMQRHPKLLQARYLSRQGQELIRINRHQDSWQIVPTEQLQNKSHRDYVVAAEALAIGETYSSTVDFNRERGSIEYPFALPAKP